MPIGNIGIFLETRCYFKQYIFYIRFMENRTEKELIKKIESGYSLPALSPVALKLVDLASDDNCSAVDLVKLIEKDPPLAVRLLKLANSAFFSSAHPVTTLDQAVIKIGFNRLRIMALSISLRDAFPMGIIGPLNYETYWRTSLYRALIAKSITDHVKDVQPEEAFISGLILEIGLLIFYDLLIKGDDIDIDLVQAPFDELITWEKKRYGIDHRQVGEAAMKHWNFPENIVICQRLYPWDMETKDVPLGIRLCEFARSLSGILFLKDEHFPSIYLKAEKYLGMNRESINQTLINTFQQVENIAEILSLELNGEQDLMALMEKANNSLIQLYDKITKAGDLLKRSSLPSFDSVNEDNLAVSHALQAVAHEIRNPLLAVGGFARKLSSSLDPSSKGGRYAKIIIEEAERLEKALSNMIQN